MATTPTFFGTPIRKAFTLFATPFTDDLIPVGAGGINVATAAGSGWQINEIRISMDRGGGGAGNLTDTFTPCLIYIWLYDGTRYTVVDIFAWKSSHMKKIYDGRDDDHAPIWIPSGDVIIVGQTASNYGMGNLFCGQA